MYIKSGTTSIPDNNELVCKRIYLPSSITYIGKNAIGCYGMNVSQDYDMTEPSLESISLILKSTTPPTTGGDIFYVNPAAYDWWKELNKPITVYVPVGTLSAYKNSPYWKNQPIKEIKEGEPTD